MKIVIVGGVAGGASAAARARRLDESAEIVLLQSGPDVSFASCGMVSVQHGRRKNRVGDLAWSVNVSSDSPLAFFISKPYFIGGEITDRGAMAVQTPESLKARLNLDVRVSTRVSKIDPDQQFVVCENDGKMYNETYDHLVLAVGAAPLKPPIPLQIPG